MATKLHLFSVEGFVTPEILTPETDIILDNCTYSKLKTKALGKGNAEDADALAPLIQAVHRKQISPIATWAIAEKTRQHLQPSMAKFAEELQWHNGPDSYLKNGYPD